jgi:hypothetical protein
MRIIVADMSYGDSTPMTTKIVESTFGGLKVRIIV